MGDAAKAAGSPVTAKIIHKVAIGASAPFLISLASSDGKKTNRRRGRAKQRKNKAVPRPPPYEKKPVTGRFQFFRERSALARLPRESFDVKEGR